MGSPWGAPDGTPAGAVPLEAVVSDMFVGGALSEEDHGAAVERRNSASAGGDRDEDGISGQQQVEGFKGTYAPHEHTSQ